MYIDKEQCGVMAKPFKFLMIVNFLNMIFILIRFQMFARAILFFLYFTNCQYEMNVIFSMFLISLCWKTAT